MVVYYHGNIPPSIDVVCFSSLSLSLSLSLSPQISLFLYTKQALHHTTLLLKNLKITNRKTRLVIIKEMAFERGFSSLLMKGRFTWGDKKEVDCAFHRCAASSSLTEIEEGSEWNDSFSVSAAQACTAQSRLQTNPA